MNKYYVIACSLIITAGSIVALGVIAVVVTS